MDHAGARVSRCTHTCLVLLFLEVVNNSLVSGSVQEAGIVVCGCGSFRPTHFDPHVMHRGTTRFKRHSSGQALTSRGLNFPFASVSYLLICTFAQGKI